MAYFLGRDVLVAITTELAGHGIDVDNTGTKDTFITGAGPSAATDANFAGPLDESNMVNTPLTGISVDTTTFGTQVGSSQNFTNEISDLTACDLTIGTVDEDVTYIGQKSTLKAEIKKETSISVTRKKTNNCWDVVFNEARYGISGADTYYGSDGPENPAVSTFGYRLYILLKSSATGETIYLPNCQITAHAVSINADGATEETLELSTHISPVVTIIAGTDLTTATTDL
jgi:hypothetical protein